MILSAGRSRASEKEERGINDGLPGHNRPDFDIQRYSIHDGRGIRTIVFL